MKCAGFLLRFPLIFLEHMVTWESCEKQPVNNWNQFVTKKITVQQTLTCSKVIIETVRTGKKKDYKKEFIKYDI